MEKMLKIALDAQLRSNQGAGGIEMVLIGLVQALGRLDGPEQYLIVGPWQQPDWLSPYIGPNQRIVPGPRPVLRRRVRAAVRRLAGRFGPTVNDLMLRWRANQVTRMAATGASSAGLPDSKGFYERLGAKAVHFPHQGFVRTTLPAVFNPHDLQHRHYPEFFAPAMLQMREMTYGPACQLATVVVAGSQWIKEDLVSQFGLTPDKVQVIPWAPPTAAYEAPDPGQLQALTARLGSKGPFAYYPAPTGRNKNHLRLLEAVALLREQGLVVNLVCSGFQHEPMWSEIRGRIQALRLENQVTFTGHLPGSDLRGLYRLAQFVVVPTLFEAASGPMFEGWQEGAPVACSNVTSLPEQAGDAALLFDPLTVEAIAEAICKMATDATLRQDLAQRGRRRLGDFSWERTAKAYRAVYRKAAGWPLTEEDRSLLSWDWMRKPRPVDA
jgi:glycosyltransferase involved in cell wall biosynthesis